MNWLELMIQVIDFGLAKAVATVGSEVRTLPNH